MKQLIIVACLFTSFALQGSNIDFKSDFNEGLKEAELNDKLLFVYVTAKWCKPCKLMEEHVFSDTLVSNFFNEHFINIKIDEAKNKAFLKEYDITAFPTLIYINHHTEMLYNLSGAAPNAKSFFNLGESILGLHELKMLEYEPNINEDFDTYLKVLHNKIFDFQFSEILFWSLFYFPNQQEYILESYISYLSLDETTFDFFDPIVLTNSKIRDQLGIKFLLENNIPQYSDINNTIKRLRKMGFQNPGESKTYFAAMIATQFNFRNEPMRVKEIEIYSKALITKYAYCWDTSLTISSLNNLIINNQLDKATLSKIMSSYEAIPKEKWNFLMFDIYSLALYEKGDNENAITHISKANDLASKENIKYIPSIHFYKELNH